MNYLPQLKLEAVYFVRKVNIVLLIKCPKCEGKAKRNTPRTIPVSTYECMLLLTPYSPRTFV